MMRTVAVVGAGGGIGRAVAKRFYAEGCSVIAGDIDMSDLDYCGGERLVGRAIDIRDEGSWRGFAADATARFGKLDVFVNAAGIDAMATVADFELDAMRNVHAVNAEGAALGLRALLPLLARSGDASAVMISSIAAAHAEAFAFSYAASKAALEVMVRSAAAYCGKKRLPVRVNAIAPGYVETKMFERFLSNTGDGASMRAYAEKKLPLGRIGAPEEIAGVAKFLASKDAAYITGQVLTVDGGASLV